MDDSLNAKDLVPPPNANQDANLRQNVIPSNGVTTQDVTTWDDIKIQDQVTTPKKMTFLRTILSDR